MSTIDILDAIGINFHECVLPLDRILITERSVNPNGDSLSSEALLHKAIRMTDAHLKAGRNVSFYFDGYDGMLTTAIRSLALDHDVKIYHTLMECPLSELLSGKGLTIESKAELVIKYNKLHQRLHALNRAANTPDNDPVGYSVRFVEYNGITEKLC